MMPYFIMSLFIWKITFGESLGSGMNVCINSPKQNYIFAVDVHYLSGTTLG